LHRKIRYFEMQHERNPRSRHFIPLADQRRRSGDLERAIAVLNEGLGANPDSLSARWLLGMCLLESGQPAAAAEQLRWVLERDPDHAGATEALAGCEAVDATAAEADDGAQAQALEPEPVAPDADAAGPGDVDVDVRPDAETRPAEEGPPEDASPRPERPSGPAIPQTPPDIPRATLDATTAPEPADATAGEDVPSTFVTRTLADIYLAQGHRDKALRILYQVLADQPDRQDILARIAALEASGEGSDAADAADGERAGQADARNRERFDAWLDDQDGEG